LRRGRGGSAPVTRTRRGSSPLWWRAWPRPSRPACSSRASASRSRHTGRWWGRVAIEPTDPGEALAWRPTRPRLHPLRLTVAWASSALALLLAAAVVAGVDINGVPGAFLVAAIVAVVNAVLPPLVAALRLPFTVLVGFLLVLALDASALLIAAAIAP